MIVAQQFTAGMTSAEIVVREADGWRIFLESYSFSAVRFTD